MREGGDARGPDAAAANFVASNPGLRRALLQKLAAARSHHGFVVPDNPGRVSPPYVRTTLLGVDDSAQPENARSDVVDFPPIVEIEDLPEPGDAEGGAA